MRHFLGIIFCVILFSFPFRGVEAALLKIDADFTALTVGDVFTVTVTLDTEYALINAVAADITFPADTLELVALDDGGTVVSLWIDRPAATSGTVTFAGVTPGGFVAPEARLIELKFRARQVGQGRIEGKNGQFLAHDGSGTAVEVSYENLHVAVKEGTSEINVQTVDDEPPEDFKPLLIQDPDIYNGDYVLVFSTQDKGSGIDFYAVKEGILARFEKTESPYRVRHQSLTVPLVVKAVDRAGNERISTLYPQNWEPWYERSRFIVGILIGCALFLYVFWLVRRRIGRG